jgi:hypothetical protein
MKDKAKMQFANDAGSRRGDADELGANSDIGIKLRALYGAVQSESIPDKFLDLLEKLDEVDQKSKPNAGQD